MLEEDPKELILSINELSYHISKDSNNTIFACYWINWIIEYELRCRRQKKELICQRRNVNVESKMQKNTIWIVWDVFLFYTKNDKVLEKIVKSSLNLFCIQYNYSSNKKYRELLYYMVMLINEKFEMPKKLISETEKINIILEKINNIYKQIKKNEVSPNTDYLFSGIGKSNLDKTISKLEAVNNNDIFLPRSIDASISEPNISEQEK